MSRYAALAAILLFSSRPWQARGQPASDKPAVEWIRSHAVALATPEAGHGFADMQPLKKFVGDARVVELGEATHGTREFFQLKHRMLEFLATEMGFTIFSIEANMPEAYRLNDSVLNGKRDPKALLRMRAFSQSGKGRVEFTGFDMQTPTEALGIASRFVEQYEPGYLAVGQGRRASGGKPERTCRLRCASYRGRHGVVRRSYRRT
ncbi:MAG: erythromycin esterase family protein [Acidobacteriota bacterium]